MVDIHRIDFNLAADQNARNKGLPRHQKPLEQWLEDGIEISGLKTKRLGSLEMPSSLDKHRGMEHLPQTKGRRNRRWNRLG